MTDDLDRRLKTYAEAARPAPDATDRAVAAVRSRRRRRAALTSGGAALEAVKALREAGLMCETAICVVDREEGGADELGRHGVKLRALYVAEKLLSTRKTAANPHG